MPKQCALLPAFLMSFLPAFVNSFDKNGIAFRSLLPQREAPACDCVQDLRPPRENAAGPGRPQDGRARARAALGPARRGARLFKQRSSSGAPAPLYLGTCPVSTNENTDVPRAKALLTCSFPVQPANSAGPEKLPPHSLYVCLTMSFVLLVDRDPAAEDHAEFLTLECAKPEERCAIVLEQFQGQTCGVCSARPLSALSLSAPWTNLRNRRTAYGFVSCDTPACKEIAQLRADTRRANVQVMLARKLLTTPDTVLKACSYCASLREVTHTSKCGQCHAVRYCNRECQRKHWKFHKPLCKNQE